MTSCGLCSWHRESRSRAQFRVRADAPEPQSRDGETYACRLATPPSLKLGEWPTHHNLAAMFARAGANVDDPIGAADRVLIMLNNDQRVAEVTEANQRFDQTTIVS